MRGVNDGGREALWMRGPVRVEAFKDSGVALKVMGVTRPVRQWEVMGELRRRLKKAFDAESIELRW